MDIIIGSITVVIVICPVPLPKPQQRDDLELTAMDRSSVVDKC